MDSQKFCVNNRDTQRLQDLVANFDYKAFGVKDPLRQAIDREFNGLLAGLQGKQDNPGFALAPYLFTWNFQRFKAYFDKRTEQFNLHEYFSELGRRLSLKKDLLGEFAERRLVREEIDERKVRDTFSGINKELSKLGIGQNEPVGVAKVLHIFAPYYFPLIDNAISRAVGLLRSKRGSLTGDLYIRWMRYLKTWLQQYRAVVQGLENEYGISILKLVDEGLYMMSTVKQQTRVSRLGIIPKC